MIRLLLPVAILAAAFWAARIVNPSELDDRFEHIEAFLRSWRGGPIAAAVVTLPIIWFVWGDARPLPIVHDESAYVLQADIFARFRWTAPSPPTPEFFEQPHVLVVPAVASKYPPGHSLLLTPGSWLHFPPFVPLLLAAATAALLMIVASRVTNPWIAVLAWIIWLTTPLVLRFQPGYFSESTTTALVLASWWLLLEWRETKQTRWLLLLALAIGWGAITRPVTMLAFALPIAGVVLWEVIRGWSWRRLVDTVLALVVTAAVLAIIPFWSERTTGNRDVTPLQLYARDYLPFDKPGFRVDSTPPARALSPVVKSLYDDFLAHHDRQRLRDLPRTAWERVAALARDLFRGTQVVLVPFLLVGLYFMRRELRFAAISALLLIIAYLPYAHDAPWTLYYLELTPVLAVITAFGVWTVHERVVQSVVIRRHIDRRPKLGTVLVAIVLVTFAIPTFARWRLTHQQMSSTRMAFEEAVRQLPSAKAIVFLRYAERPHHVSLVYNHADLARAPVWVVHDLGTEMNRELVQSNLDRTPFVFDEALMEFKRF